MEDQAKKEISNQPSQKEKGGLRRFIKAAGQKSVAATGAVASSALSGVGSVAGAASRQAKLLRAPTIDPHHIPLNPSLNWLRLLPSGCKPKTKGSSNWKPFPPSQQTNKSC